MHGGFPPSLLKTYFLIRNLMRMFYPLWMKYFWWGCSCQHHVPFTNILGKKRMDFRNLGDKIQKIRYKKPSGQIFSILKLRKFSKNDILKNLWRRGGLTKLFLSETKALAFKPAAHICYDQIWLDMFLISIIRFFSIRIEKTLAEYGIHIIGFRFDGLAFRWTRFPTYPVR